MLKDFLTHSSFIFLLSFYDISSPKPGDLLLTSVKIMQGNQILSCVAINLCFLFEFFILCFSIAFILNYVRGHHKLLRAYSL